MAELQNPDPLVEAVAKARKESSRRPDLKLPTGGRNEINGKVYSYSGSINIANGATATMLEFTTAENALECSIQQGRNDKTSAELVAEVFINNIQIWYSKMDNGKNPTMAPFNEPINIIIPAYAHLKYTLMSTDDSSAGMTALLTGEVI